MINNITLHIGIVLPSVPGYSETFFRNKIRGLQQRGHEITLFVKNPAGRGEFICPVKVHPNLSQVTLIRLIQTFSWLLYSFIFAPKAALKLWELTKANDFPIVKRLRSIVIASSILPHKLDWLHFGFATPGIEREMIGAAIGAKVALSFRGYDISVYPLKHKDCYKLLWKFIDKVHVISDDLLAIAYKNGLPRDIPMVKITPSIRVEDFLTNRLLGKETETVLILTVARLHWKKGIEYTLEALAILKKRGFSFSYKIAGEGDELERLKFAAHQLDLTDEVIFLGKKSHDQVKSLMLESEIYLQYSIQEGFCNAVLEAQASGSLCIVSNAEGLSENVINEQTGWVVPKRRPDLLANKLEYLMNLPASKQQIIRENAQGRISKEFDLKLQEKAFEKFYQE